MNAGQLDKLALIYEPVTVQSSYGEKETTYELGTMLWGSLKNKQSTESNEASQFTGISNYEFHARYYDATSITTAHQLEIDGVKFLITGKSEIGRKDKIILYLQTKPI
jgi:head-tail adaptor